MSSQPIRTYGDPCLKAVSKPVEDFDGALHDLIEAMSETLYAEAHHIGLAAPQVGVNQRVFLMDVDWVDLDEDGNAQKNLQVFVNPEIVWQSDEDCSMSEGCLSLPDIEGEVYRPSEVKMRYFDAEGNQKERLLQEMESRCAQHEIDHLDGVLFVDRMPFVRRSMLAGKLNRLKKQCTA
jgi:peptide deformylase